LTPTGDCIKSIQLQDQTSSLYAATLRFYHLKTGSFLFVGQQYLKLINDEGSTFSFSNFGQQLEFFKIDDDSLCEKFSGIVYKLSDTIMKSNLSVKFPTRSILISCGSADGNIYFLADDFMVQVHDQQHAMIRLFKYHNQGGIVSSMAVTNSGCVIILENGMVAIFSVYDGTTGQLLKVFKQPSCTVRDIGIFMLPDDTLVTGAVNTNSLCFY